MDSAQFDRVVRSWSDGTPRRAIFGLLAASALGLASVRESPAKGRKKKVTLWERFFYGLAFVQFFPGVAIHKCCNLSRRKPLVS